MPANISRAISVELYAIEHGDEAALKAFEIKEDSLRRYRGILIEHGIDLSSMRDAQSLLKTFGKDTIKDMLKSGSLNPYQELRHKIDFSGDTIKFIGCGDTHFGSKYTLEEYWDAVINIAEEEDVDFIAHDGDLTEGMSSRPGHIYELSHIGYDAQRDFAVEQLAKTNIPIYIIDGNHDRWFKKSNGALIVKDVASALDHVTYLGHDSATLDINGMKIMLWHGEDGASYAHSYRPQKVVEALSGNDLPHVILMGHTHKAGTFRVRGVQTVSTGSIQSQSGWMKATRKETHHGFYVIEATWNGERVTRFKTEWFDFGEELI